MPIYTMTAAAACDLCEAHHPAGMINAEDMDALLSSTGWHIEHEDDGAVVTCPTCWENEHGSSWYILGHRYFSTDTWEQFDRYIYEPQNEIVQRKDRWAIIKCPSKYLAEYQLGRLHSGMLGGYGGPYPKLSLAQAELHQKVQEDVSGAAT